MSMPVPVLNVVWPIDGTLRIMGPLTRDESDAFAFVYSESVRYPDGIPLHWHLEDVRAHIIGVRMGEVCRACAYTDAMCGACEADQYRRDLMDDMYADIAAGVADVHGWDAVPTEYR